MFTKLKSSDTSGSTFALRSSDDRRSEVGLFYTYRTQINYAIPSSSGYGGHRPGEGYEFRGNQGAKAFQHMSIETIV